MDFLTTLLHRHRELSELVTGQRLHWDSSADCSLLCKLLKLHVLHHTVMADSSSAAQYRAAEESTHIFESLFGAPPVTFATLRAPSSCFSSFS